MSRRSRLRPSPLILLGLGRLPVVSVFVLRRKIVCVASHPVPQLRLTTGVLGGVHGRLVELFFLLALVTAVFHDRDLWVMQIKSRRLRPNLRQLGEVVARR